MLHDQGIIHILGSPTNVLTLSLSFYSSVWLMPLPGLVNGVLPNVAWRLARAKHNPNPSTASQPSSLQTRRLGPE